MNWICNGFWFGRYFERRGPELFQGARQAEEEILRTFGALPGIQESDGEKA